MRDPRCAASRGDRCGVDGAGLRGVGRVELTKRPGVQARRDAVDDIDDGSSPTLDDLRPDQRGHVLGGLELTIIGEHDVVVEGRVGGEQQRHVDGAVAQGLVGRRSSDVERYEVGERRPVPSAQPDLAQRTSRALGRTAERELTGDGGQVAQLVEPVGRGRLRRDDEGVGVLRRRRVQGDDVDVRRGSARARRASSRGRRSARSAPRLAKVSADPAYSGTSSTSPARSAGPTNSRGPRLSARSTANPSCSRAWP